MTDVMREKIYEILDEARSTCPDDWNMNYWEANAVIAALPGMVPPLVWVDLHGDGSLYQTSNENPLDYYAVINSRGRLGFWYFGLYDTLESAKAAAQAEYASRIMQALGVEQENK